MERTPYQPPNPSQGPQDLMQSISSSSSSSISSDGLALSSIMKSMMKSESDSLFLPRRGIEVRESTFEHPAFRTAIVQTLYTNSYTETILKGDKNSSEPISPLSESDWLKVIEQDSTDQFDDIDVYYSLLKGVPDNMRTNLWRTFIKLNKNTSYFKYVFYEELATAQLSASDQELLWRDIRRTMCEEEYFKNDADNANKKKLYNILAAYMMFESVFHNNKKGYAQGMNEIAGRILIIIDYYDEIENRQRGEELESAIKRQEKRLKMSNEEFAFWTFLNIMHTKKWRETMLSQQRDMQLMREFEAIMRDQIAPVYDHIVKNYETININYEQLYMETFYKMIMTLLLCQTSVELSKQILDLYLFLNVDPVWVVIPIIMKMLDIFKKKILTFQTVTPLREFLKEQMIVEYEQLVQAQYNKSMSASKFALGIQRIIVEE